MPDGLIKHVQVVAHAVRDQADQLEFIGTVMDVTESRRDIMEKMQAQDALQAARAELVRSAHVSRMGADVIRRQMARIAELEAEVERLRSAARAHEVLKNIYSDVTQPTGHRIKAAGLAIGHEEPKIQSVPPALELTAQEVEPLAVTVERQRVRANRLLALSLEERSALIAGVRGSGSDD
jgi:hypothetical protein